MPLPHTPKTDWTAADGVADADLNQIGANLIHLEQHEDKTTAPVHGSASAKTAGRLVHRDANGRARVEDPAHDDDIVNLKTHNAHATSTANPHTVTKTQVGLTNVDNVKQMPIAGGTFTGRAIAHSPDTDYTTKQIRNIFFSTAAPTAGDGENGDLWVRYEV